MSKYISISIQEPCTQDWDTMLPNQLGRHCNSCQKTVVDFTEMRDTQIINYLQKNKTGGCGIFNNNQLESKIIIPKKPLPWLKYFFSITLPAFLFSQKVWAQKKIAKAEITLAKPSIAVAKVVPITKVKDSVVVLDEVVVKAIKNLVIKGSYTIGAYSTLSCRTAGKNMKAEKNKEIVLNDINIYPNPILQNTNMNISWKMEIINNQFVEIFNANGALIQKEIIPVSTKSKTAFFTLTQMVKGLYIIRITDTKTQVKMSKEFIVI